jgi:hypothetical protein
MVTFPPHLLCNSPRLNDLAIRSNEYLASKIFLLTTFRFRATIPMESAPQQRSVAQPSSSTRSPRFFPNSASTQRPLRLSVILCPKSTKTATLTTFRINTCKSVSKQATLTPFRMNTYEKTGGGGTPGKEISNFPVRDSANVRRMRHVAALSPVFSLDCAYFLSPRGCVASSFQPRASSLQNQW